MSDFCLNNINTDIKSYNQFINLYYELKNLRYEKITIDLRTWFGANMSAVLGGILDSLSSTNEIRIIGNPDILAILKKNQFLAHYGYKNEVDMNDTTVKFLKLEASDNMYFNEYISSNLLNKPDLPKMSKLLKKKISESIYEIFVNAQIHSNTKNIYTCGQFFPKKSSLEFTIVDMGQGFKSSINKRFNSNLSAIEAIRWSIKDGNTTKTETPGGIGLAILKDFIKLNKGKFQIISDCGAYELTREQKENYTEFSRPFPGTVVNMVFRTDDSCLYRFKSELVEDEDIF